MPVLKIIQYPDPILKQRSIEVKGIGPEVSSLIKDLVDTMKASPGVGLAAPQLGVLKRIIAVDVTPKNPGHGLIVLINPEIISSKGSVTVREGCLSIPEYTANIQRAGEVTVRGFDENWQEKVTVSTGFEAVALQHETDHLDGILFIDRISNMKRDLFKRKIRDF